MSAAEESVSDRDIEQVVCLIPLTFPDVLYLQVEDFVALQQSVVQDAHPQDGLGLTGSKADTLPILLSLQPAAIVAVQLVIHVLLRTLGNVVILHLETTSSPNELREICG